MNSASQEPFPFGVLILAAGRSQRMGRPKMLLPWGTTTVLGHLLAQWQGVGAAQVAVVHAPKDEALQLELHRLNFPPANRVMNPEPQRGMFSSVQEAARWNGWNPALTHIAITLGDQPHLQDQTLRRLLELAAQNPDSICQPLRSGRRKHPVILPRRAFTQIAFTKAATLKDFLAEHAALFNGFESDDEGLDSDMDTPADYERLLNRENRKQ